MKRIERRHLVPVAGLFFHMSRTALYMESFRSSTIRHHAATGLALSLYNALLLGPAFCVLSALV